MEKDKQHERMIDTVILSVPLRAMREIVAAGNDTTEWKLHGRGKGFKKYVRNPSKENLASGRYFPRLTAYHRQGNSIQWEVNVYIEFSCAKLIYQNNVDELSDAQFDAVVRALRDRIEEMGLEVSMQILAEATVRAVHYAKNFVLAEGYTSQYVIGELNKINPNQPFDMTRARYMNDGQSLCIYSQSHSLVIYDKIADLIRSKKRAIDKDQTPMQMSLFKAFTHKSAPQEILRIEARLSQKAKMNSMLKQLGFAENPTFKEVFACAKSEAVLMHYWETFLNKNMAILFAHLPTIKDLLKQIQLSFSNAKPKEVIYRAGLIWLIRDGNGMRELRAILTKRANDQTWYRIAKTAREIGEALGKFRPRSWYEHIQRTLKNYKPIHTADLQCKEL